MAPSPAQNKFPDVPSYDVHHRLVTTHAHDLVNGNHLLDALAKRTGKGGRKVEFEFATTPYAFCEVLSVAAPETTVALLDAGITSADDAIAFLEDAGLDDLIEDNSGIAEAALRWAAMPSEVLDRFHHSPESFYDDPEGFESRLGEDLLAKLRGNKAVWAAVQERRIDVRDILHIGVSRFLDAEDDDATLSGMLASLQADRSQPIRAEDISEWIERFDIEASTPDAIKQGLYHLAARHGPDFAAQIPRNENTLALAVRLSHDAHAQGRALDEEQSIILFGVQVWPDHGMS